MTKLTLEEKLRRTPISLIDDDVLGLPQERPWDKDFFKGNIVENMAHRWLQMCDVTFEANFPQEIGEYKWIRRGNSIYIIKGEPIYQFDEMLAYNNQSYVVEVKSGNDGSMRKKLEDGFSFGEMFYQKPVHFLWLTPFYDERKRDKLASFERDFPRLHCVDLGYTKEELCTFVAKHLSKKKKKKRKRR